MTQIIWSRGSEPHLTHWRIYQHPPILSLCRPSSGGKGKQNCLSCNAKKEAKMTISHVAGQCEKTLTAALAAKEDCGWRQWQRTVGSDRTGLQQWRRVTMAMADTGCGGGGGGGWQRQIAMAAALLLRRRPVQLWWLVRAARSDRNGRANSV